MALLIKSRGVTPVSWPNSHHWPLSINADRLIDWLIKENVHMCITHCMSVLCTSGRVSCMLVCECECAVAVVLREAQVCVRAGLDSQLLSRWNVCYAEIRTIGILQLFLALPPTHPPFLAIPLLVTFSAQNLWCLFFTWQFTLSRGALKINICFNNAFCNSKCLCKNRITPI